MKEGKNQLQSDAKSISDTNVVLGRRVSPQNTYPPSECDLIWNQGLCGRGQVKGRSYRIRVSSKSNVTGINIMREICIQTLLNQEKAQWRRRMEWCVSHINQGQARSTSNHRRLEEARNGFSLRASMRNQAFQQLHCWLLASKTVRWYIFRCFKLPALFVVSC